MRKTQILSAYFMQIPRELLAFVVQEANSCERLSPESKTIERDFLGRIVRTNFDEWGTGESITLYSD